MIASVEGVIWLSYLGEKLDRIITDQTLKNDPVELNSLEIPS